MIIFQQRQIRIYRAVTHIRQLLFYCFDEVSQEAASGNAKGKRNHFLIGSIYET